VGFTKQREHKHLEFHSICDYAVLFFYKQFMYFIYHVQKKRGQMFTHIVGVIFGGKNI